jgi:peptidoglycan-N-acetylmuramic acid deacetylase
MTSPDPLNKKTGVGRLPTPVFFQKNAAGKSNSRGPQYYQTARSDLFRKNTEKKGFSLKHPVLLYVKRLGILLLCITLFPSFLRGAPSFGAEQTTPYNWYFKKNDCHEQPPLDGCLKFIKEYDGYYLDENCNEKVLYLTFDAGYENGNITLILDALKKHNAPAAFFVLDNLIKRNPELVKRMAEEGHLVCNHTAKHPDMSAITDKSLFEKQLTALEKSYTEIIGGDLARYYRPPQGRFSMQNLKYAKEMGYKTVFWSYAYADWDNNRQPDPQKAKEQIMLHTHPGMVILLHPTSRTNARIMDELLSLWEAEGYRFGTLEELTS